MVLVEKLKVKRGLRGDTHMELSNQAKKTFKQFLNSEWTYRQIAEEMSLNPEKFEQFMNEKYPNKKEGADYELSYTLECAERLRTDYHEWEL